MYIEIIITSLILFVFLIIFAVSAIKLKQYWFVWLYPFIVIFSIWGLYSFSNMLGYPSMGTVPAEFRLLAFVEGSEQDYIWIKETSSQFPKAYVIILNEEQKKKLRQGQRAVKNGMIVQGRYNSKHDTYTIESNRTNPNNGVKK